MKKYLCILLSVILIFTLSVPAFSAGIQERDLLDYMFIKNVEPPFYSGAIMSFLSYESDENGIYTLCESDNLEMVTEAVSDYLSQFGVTREEIEPYLLQFHEFFSAKPDLFTAFCGFMLNVDNKEYFMPNAEQDRFEEEMPGVNALIRENFYCETFFLNLLSRINDEYYKEKNDAAFMYYNEEICMKGDAMDYANFFETNDSSVISAAQIQIENMLSAINTSDPAEKSAFVEFMILMGILSLNMDDSAVEGDPVVDSVYDEMAKNYAEGSEETDAFYTLDSVVKEYLPLINAQSSQQDKKDVIYDAMSKAATIRLSENTVEDKKATVKISDSDLFSFAALSAQQARNKLVEENITVSKLQPFAVRILAENAESIKVSLPKSGLAGAKSQYADKLEIIFSGGKLVVDLKTALESDVFSGNTMVFEVLRGSADTIIPTLSKYAQGSEVIKVSAGNGGAIAYDVMYIELDVAGQEDKWEENKVYSIAEDGTRKLADNYFADGDKVSFEIGSGKYFAKIDGELKNFDDNDEENTSSTPQPTQKPSGSEWIDHGDDENDKNDENDENNQQGNTSGDNEKENTGGEPYSPSDKPGKAEAAVSFDDVQSGHWAKSYIEELASKGILSGVGNGLFKPEDYVTREQFAKIIAEAFAIVNEDALHSFSDVESGAWYEKYVASVYDREIVNGIGEGKFGVGIYMTRQDMAVMLVRCMKELGISYGEPLSHEFNDNGKIADYAAEAVGILVGEKVISGFEDNTFRPVDYCTRAQVAKIISTVLE